MISKIQIRRFKLVLFVIKMWSSKGWWHWNKIFFTNSRQLIFGHTRRLKSMSKASFTAQWPWVPFGLTVGVSANWVRIQAWLSRDAHGAIMSIQHCVFVIALLVYRLPGPQVARSGRENRTWILGNMESRIPLMIALKKLTTKDKCLWTKALIVIQA